MISSVGMLHLNTMIMSRGSTVVRHAWHLGIACVECVYLGGHVYIVTGYVVHVDKL